MAAILVAPRHSDVRVDALIAGNKWADGTITYSFPTLSSQYTDLTSVAYYLGTFAALNPAWQAAIRNVLTGAVVGGAQQPQFASVSAITNLTFSETAGGSATMRFGYYRAKPTAEAFYPWPDGQGGDVWFNDANYLTSPVISTYTWSAAILHEIGHALGLKHGHEAPAVPAAFDSIEYTVMTYRTYVGQQPGANGAIGFNAETFGGTSSFMMLDIAALQRMYGANFNTLSGNTTYQWNPNTGAMSINGVSQGTPGANRVFLTIWDGGGIDTYDMSNYTTGVTINLEPGSHSVTSQVQLSYLGGGVYARGNVFNALQYQGDPRSLIENATGGSAADILTGNAANNALRGGLGADTLTGAGGVDTFLYGTALEIASNDQITDFQLSLDRIDFSAVAGVTFIGTANFSNVAGQINYTTGGGQTTIRIDINGDGASDGFIRLNNGAFTLTQTAAGSKILVASTGAAPDTAAPLLVGTAPPDNATAISVGANIQLTFNEAVQAGTGAVEIRRSADNSLFRSIAIGDASQVSFSGGVVTINSGADLLAGVGYYVTVASGVIRDLAGNAFTGIAGATAFNFTTTAVADITAPTLLSSTPADNSTGFGVTSNLLLNFSEAVQVGAGNIEIRRSSDNTVFRTIQVTDVSQVTFSGATMTINPAVDLAPGTGYYLTIAAGAVRDAAANAFAGIASATALNFTTGGNDDFAASTATTGVATVGGFATGTLEIAGDADWFRITLTSGRAYRFEVEGQPTGQGTLDDPFLDLRDSAGGLVASFDDGGVGFNTRGTRTIATGGTYYLAVSSYPGAADLTGTYRLIVTDITGDIVAPTLTGSSPADNDTGVAVGANIVLTFSEQVTMGAGLIEIRRVSNNQVVHSINVTDISQVAFAGTQVTINPATDLLGGVDYYVTIAAGAVRDLASNSYAGIATATGLNFRTAGGDDFAATTATAGVVPVNSFTTGSIETAGDQDWFAVSLVAGRTYRFDLEGVETGRGTLTDPYLELRNGAGGLVLTDDDGGAGRNSAIIFAATQTGTFYLSAAAYGGSSNPLGTYRVSATELFTAGSDDFAGNSATSGVVSVGGSRTGALETIGDVDWFRVTLIAGHAYRLDLEGADTQRGSLDDPYLRVYSSGGLLLSTFDDDGVGLNSQGVFVPATGGTYYLAASAYPFAANPLGTYSLSVADLSFSGLNVVLGTPDPDSKIGTASPDLILGLGGDDQLEGLAGDDELNGGDGYDVAVFAFDAEDYDIWQRPDGAWVVKDLVAADNQGRDVLFGIEEIWFDDRTFYLYDLTNDELLSLAYESILRIGAFTAADSAYLSALTGQVNAAGKSLDQAIGEIVAKADQTTAVAVMSYQFFAGFVPSKGGLDYLVSPTGPNPNNINSAYYQSFNIENRYINFAVNLGKFGEGSTAFLAEYGPRTLFQATKAAYMEIFGGTVTDAKISSILDTNVGAMTRAQYFASYGGDGLTGIGTKAAMVGWLLTEAAKADLGMYALSSNAFLTDLADGAETLIDLIGDYGSSDYIFNG